MLLLKCELKTYTTDHLFLHLSTHYFGGRSKRELSCLEIRSSSRFLREIWISYFARKILEGVFVRGIVNIRNGCLFSRFMGNESQCGTNKSREPRSEKPRKKDTHSLIGHSFLKFSLILLNSERKICDNVM